MSTRSDRATAAEVAEATKKELNQWVAEAAPGLPPPYTQPLALQVVINRPEKQRLDTPDKRRFWAAIFAGFLAILFAAIFFGFFAFRVYMGDHPSPGQLRLEQNQQIFNQQQVQRQQKIDQQKHDSDLQACQAAVRAQHGNSGDLTDCMYHMGGGQ